MTASIQEMVDTNILIYAHDPDAGDRHTRALDLIQLLTHQAQLTLSVQALNEFYVAATRPHKPPSLPHDEAARIIHDLTDSAEVLPLTPTATFLALDVMPRHSLSFWDALVWAVAKENGVSLIYTEDFQDGREIDGVRFRNPFLPGS
jgi:predicted nucleic acid-binding protein